MSKQIVRDALADNELPPELVYGFMSKINPSDFTPSKIHDTLRWFLRECLKDMDLTDTAALVAMLEGMKEEPLFTESTRLEIKHNNLLDEIIKELNK